MISQQHMLCGDEVKAIVVDIGSSTCKFGTAGQDMPRHVFRSEIGCINEENQSQKLVYGTSGFRYIRNNLVMHDFISSGDKWDHISKLLHHGTNNCMKIDCSEYPIMISRNACVGGPECHAKMMELCLETERFPAMYMASSGALSSFSAGRPCSLVVDLGASGTTITPVVDGYELSRAAIRTGKGSNMLDMMIRREIEEVGRHVIRPWYETKASLSGSIVPTNSFREMHVNDVVRDVKQWMCFVPHNSFLGSEREAFCASRMHQLPAYELPDGSLVQAGDALCTAPERLFFPMSKVGGADDMIRPNFSGKPPSGGEDLIEVKGELLGSKFGAPNPINQLASPTNDESLTALVYACVAQCDVDARKDLLSNILLVGGGSLVDGLAQRLAYELGEVVPSHLKVKLTSASSAERQNAAWIGGSILSICGSFQQNWLSRAEYEEQGAFRCAERFDH